LKGDVLPMERIYFSSVSLEGQFSPRHRSTSKTRETCRKTTNSSVHIYGLVVHVVSTLLTASVKSNQSSLKYSTVYIHLTPSLAFISN